MEPERNSSADSRFGWSSACQLPGRGAPKSDIRFMQGLAAS